MLWSNLVTICSDQLCFFLAVLGTWQHCEPEKVPFPEWMTPILTAGTPMWHCSGITIRTRTSGVQEFLRTVSGKTAMLTLTHYFVGSHQLLLSMWDNFCVLKVMETSMLCCSFSCWQEELGSCKLEVQLSEKIFSHLKVVDNFIYRLLLDKSVSWKQMVADCKFFMMLLSDTIEMCE